MQWWRIVIKNAAILTGSLLLSGCVLDSRTPLFGDTQGVLALEPFGKTFTADSFSDGAWKREEGTASFTPEGRHYMVTAPDGKEPIELLFVPLEGNRFVGQAREGKDKSFVYLIAEVNKNDVLITLPSCDELKKPGTFGGDIRFDGDGCAFTGTPQLQLFSRIASAVALTLRLAPTP